MLRILRKKREFLGIGDAGTYWVEIVELCNFGGLEESNDALKNESELEGVAAHLEFVSHQNLLAIGNVIVESQNNILPQFLPICPQKYKIQISPYE